MIAPDRQCSAMQVYSEVSAGVLGGPYSQVSKHRIAAKANKLFCAFRLVWFATVKIQESAPRGLEGDSRERSD